MSAVDRRAVGRVLSVAVVAGSLLLAIVVVGRVVRHPQTDDATVMADVINVVPEVAGRIVELHVVDNQAVKQGDLLFIIDPRAYELAVAHGRADVDALDAEIALTQRRIEGQVYATAAARAAVQRAEAQARNAAALPRPHPHRRPAAGGRLPGRRLGRDDHPGNPRNARAAAAR